VTPLVLVEVVVISTLALSLSVAQLQPGVVRNEARVPSRCREEF
jgi:hypothetical protein